MIPAAGKGTRFKELGKLYPKCVLPVEGVPIIVRTLQALGAGWSQIVITVATSQARDEIQRSLMMFRLDNIDVLLLNEEESRSPASSLAAGCRYITDRVNSDVDVTVFLSDMVPSDAAASDAVISLPANCWLVEQKDEGDFARWCMVRETADGLEFFDKPAERPPTVYAANGAYRYSTALDFCRAFEIAARARSDSAGELQFSDVALEYQKLSSRNRLCYVVTNSPFSDYGTLETYLGNKGLSNRSRSFNNVSLDKESRIVTKTSTDAWRKIDAESNYMYALPDRLRRYFPALYSRWHKEQSYTTSGYSMAMVQSTNLRDLLLYVDRSYDTWKVVFREVMEYMTRAATIVDTPSDVDFWEEFVSRVADRVKDGSDQIKNWVRERLPFVVERISKTRSVRSIMHGDLHFANMFYDFVYDDLKLVDPRGELQGDTLYDLIKLAHSVYGRYDYIDSDLFVISDIDVLFYDKGHEHVERAFDEVFGISADEKVLLLELAAALFFSMIPLHHDAPEHCELFEREGWRLIALARERGSNSSIYYTPQQNRGATS